MEKLQGFLLSAMLSSLFYRLTYGTTRVLPCRQHAKHRMAVSGLVVAASPLASIRRRSPHWIDPYRTDMRGNFPSALDYPRRRRSESHVRVNPGTNSQIRTPNVEPRSPRSNPAVSVQWRSAFRSRFFLALPTSCSQSECALSEPSLTFTEPRNSGKRILLDTRFPSTIGMD